MQTITPRPHPAAFTSVPEREGWTSAPLAVVRETQWNQTRDASLIAAPQSVHQGFAGDPSSAINDRVFEPAGSTLVEALQFARDRALHSFENPPAEHSMQGFQSQAVLQASTGAYYVTGLDRQDRPIPFDLDEDTAGSGPAKRVVEVLELHPSVQAIVGRETWVPADGVEAQVSA